MIRLFHVTSSANRASIEAHGLDWRRMGAATGIAGSRGPEVAGVFVSEDEFEVDYFVGMNNTGGPVDVWAIDGVDGPLVDSDTGYRYLPRTVAPKHLTVLRRDAKPTTQWDSMPDGSGTAYRSSLTVTLDDGRVLTGDAARDFLTEQP